MELRPDFFSKDPDSLRIYACVAAPTAALQLLFPQVLPFVLSYLFYRSVIVCRLKHSLKFASYIIDAYCQLNLAATIYSVFHRVAIVEIGIARQL